MGHKELDQAALVQSVLGRDSEERPSYEIIAVERPANNNNTSLSISVAVKWFLSQL
jgi:hypothetical protein